MADGAGLPSTCVRPTQPLRSGRSLAFPWALPDENQLGTLPSPSSSAASMTAGGPRVRLTGTHRSNVFPVESTGGRGVGRAIGRSGKASARRSLSSPVPAAISGHGARTPGRNRLLPRTCHRPLLPSVWNTFPVLCNLCGASCLRGTEGVGEGWALSLGPGLQPRCWSPQGQAVEEAELGRFSKVSALLRGPGAWPARSRRECQNP